MHKAEASLRRFGSKSATALHACGIASVSSFDSPKSQIFANPKLESSTFSGFRSRWI